MFSVIYFEQCSNRANVHRNMNQAQAHKLWASLTPTEVDAKYLYLNGKLIQDVKYSDIRT
jgi:hypothetical protein